MNKLATSLLALECVELIEGLIKPRDSEKANCERLAKEASSLRQALELATAEKHMLQDQLHGARQHRHTFEMCSDCGVIFE